MCYERTKCPERIIPKVRTVILTFYVGFERTQIYLVKLGSGFS